MSDNGKFHFDSISQFTYDLQCQLTCLNVKLLIFVVSKEIGFFSGQLEPSLENEIKSCLMKLFGRFHRQKYVRLFDDSRKNDVVDVIVDVNVVDDDSTLL